MARAKYLEVAASASETLTALFDLLPEEHRREGAELIARTFNYGIRISPRGVQSTVRINAVQEATKNLPISCHLVEKETFTGRTYKALVVTSCDPNSAKS